MAWCKQRTRVYSIIGELPLSSDLNEYFLVVCVVYDSHIILVYTRRFLISINAIGLHIALENMGFPYYRFPVFKVSIPTTLKLRKLASPLLCVLMYLLYAHPQAWLLMDGVKLKAV